MAIIASFSGVYLLPNTLDYSIRFTSLSTMQIMLTSLLFMIHMLPSLTSAFVCWTRIQYFLAPSTNSEAIVSILQQHEQQQTNQRVNAGDNCLLSADNVAAGWQLNSPALCKLSFVIRTSQIAVISGPSGCGKSTVSASILHDIKTFSGAGFKCCSCLGESAKNVIHQRNDDPTKHAVWTAIRCITLFHGCICMLLRRRLR